LFHAVKEDSVLNKLVVDLAGYTDCVDPLPLHEAGVQMAILKVDSLFVRNAEIFANSGMPIAAYHWVDPTLDAEEQVDATLNIIRRSGLPVLAIFPVFEQYWSRWNEWYFAVTGKLTWNLVSRFAGDKLSNHAKQVFEGLEASEWRIFGYTKASFVRQYAPQAAEWMSTYRWWLSHHLTYGRQTLTWDDLQTRILPTVDFPPNLPPGISQKQVIGHQFTGDELFLPGLYEDKAHTIYSAADVSLFSDEFLKELGAVPEPKPVPDYQYEAVVTAFPTLNVRSGPGINYPKLYTLNKNAVVRLTEIKDGWGKLQSYGEEWCSAAYLKVVTALPPEPQDIQPVIEDPVEIFDGITYQKARRFNANCHILLIDPIGRKFHVTPYTGLKPVSQAARQLGASIVVNGDGWGTRQQFPNSIAASDGNFYMRGQMDYNPWINISKDNKITFAWRKPENLYNAVSGDRYLIENGKYNEAITNVTKDPRTVIGLSRQNKLILIVADGRTSQSAGLSFREASTMLLEFDAVTAINLDGGGSSALWINDRIVNVPIDEGIPGKERAVANHLCIFQSQ
jgi:hypothetical protein